MFRGGLCTFPGVSCSCGRCSSERPRLPWHTLPATDTDPHTSVPITRPRTSRLPDLLLLLFPSVWPSQPANGAGAGRGRLGSTSPALLLLGSGAGAPPPPRCHRDDWALGVPALLPSGVSSNALWHQTPGPWDLGMSREHSGGPHPVT